MHFIGLCMQHVAREYAQLLFNSIMAKCHISIVGKQSNPIAEKLLLSGPSNESIKKQVYVNGL